MINIRPFSLYCYIGYHETRRLGRASAAKRSHKENPPLILVRGGISVGIISRFHPACNVSRKKTCRFVSAVTGGDPVQPTLCPENAKGEFGGRLRDGTCAGLLGRRAFSPMTRPLWASLPGRFPSMPVSDGSYYKTSGGNCQGGGFCFQSVKFSG